MTMGPGFHFASQAIEPGIVPTVGQHTDEILHELGYSDTEVADMKASGAF